MLLIRVEKVMNYNMGVVTRFILGVLFWFKCRQRNTIMLIRGAVPLVRVTAKEAHDADQDQEGVDLQHGDGRQVPSGGGGGGVVTLVSVTAEEDEAA